jgi:hypothetical protein
MSSEEVDLSHFFGKAACYPGVDGIPGYSGLIKDKCTGYQLRNGGLKSGFREIDRGWGFKLINRWIPADSWTVLRGTPLTFFTPDSNATPKV